MHSGSTVSRSWKFSLCSLGIATIFLWIAPSVCVAGDHCEICKKEILETIYLKEDKVAHTKYFICSACITLPDVCYLCGKPVLKDFTKLPDDRVICNRDSQSVIIDEREAVEICAKVKEELDRQFIRFISFPETNVTVGLIDRVSLLDLYKIVGKDFTCPDTRGCTETKTNNGQQEFAITILSGQPREDLIATCVHEYGHTWINENVPAPRIKQMDPNSIEGFCELLSYLYADAQGLKTAQTNILANSYTRGQIHQFIAAEQRFGFQDVVDWMKAGDDASLLKEDLSRVRRLADPPKRTSQPTAIIDPAAETLARKTNAPPKLPERLVLQGILWSPGRSMATINGRNFFQNETAAIKLASGLVSVQCVEIQPTLAIIRTNKSPERVTLWLDQAGPSGN